MARRLAREIAVALSHTEALKVVGGSRALLENDLAAAGVSNGHAGLAVLFATCANVLEDAQFIELAWSSLETARRALERPHQSFGLCWGLVGYGWALEEVQSLLGPLDEDVNEDIDTLVAARLRSDETLEADLFNGLVGLGTYTVRRLPRQLAAENLSVIVERLASIGVSSGLGVHWPMRNYGELPEAPHANYLHCLGMAHGSAGAIDLLARVTVADTASAIARDLLARGVQWTLEHKRSLLEGTDRSVLSWCWGDPAISIALAHAGLACSQRLWMDQAEAIAHAALRHPIDRDCLDACVCHGTAGTAHLFNRLFQIFGVEAFRVAAVQALHQTFAMRSDGVGVCGFDFEAARRDGIVERGPRIGVTFGAAGVALTLLSACSERELTWDGFMLLNSLEDIA